MPCRIEPAIYWSKPNKFRDHCIAMLTFFHLSILDTLIPFLTNHFSLSGEIREELREFFNQGMFLITEAFRQSFSERRIPSTSSAAKARNVRRDAAKLSKNNKPPVLEVAFDDALEFERFVRDIELILSEDIQQLPRPLFCYYCHARGHIAKDCPKLKQKRCFRCHQTGHIKRFCKLNTIPNLI